MEWSMCREGGSPPEIETHLQTLGGGESLFQEQGEWYCLVLLGAPNRERHIGLNVHVGFFFGSRGFGCCCG
jgi:hypothetical protein